MEIPLVPATTGVIFQKSHRYFRYEYKSTYTSSHFWPWPPNIRQSDGCQRVQAPEFLDFPLIYQFILEP